MITPKENALRIIRFNSPDRVMGSAPGYWMGYHGVNHEGYAGGGHDLPVGSRWTDIWGVGWQREMEGVMGFPRVHPLADLPRSLKEYRWPDPDDERLCSAIYRRAREWNQSASFLQGSHRDTLWEKSYMLVGMEDMMQYFFTEPDAVRELLHRIMNFQLGIARHYLRAGIEMAMCGDDLGTQRGLLLSPRIVREFLVPEYRRLFDFYRQHGVIIWFHSCGHITPLLELFMELGIDILNPIQATANDLSQVRRVTQGRMALEGGISSALIVKGPPEAIRREVAARIRQLGRDGGYFCAPDQGMPWPPEHLAALHQAVEESGAYPIADLGDECEPHAH